jgi:hypothetical protein
MARNHRLLCSGIRNLANFVNAYNFGRRLKTLKGLTPYEAICKFWTKEPKRFRLHPLHQMPALNILARSIRISPSIRPVDRRM